MTDFLHSLPTGFLIDYLTGASFEKLSANHRLSTPDVSLLCNRLRGQNIWPNTHILKAGAPSTAEQTSLAVREEDSYEQDGTWNKNLYGTRIRTLAQLIEACQIDLTEWKIERCKINKWEVGAKNKDNDLQAHPLYQVSAVMVPLTFQKNVRDEIRDILLEARSAAPMPGYLANPTFNADGHYMLACDVPDLHMGKLAWAEESGENYDSDIAEELYELAVEDFINKSQYYPLEEIWLPIGNDMLNADNSANLTTHGTPQGCDSRHQKTFRRTRQLITRTVLKLREIAPVRVITVPGNHDQETSFYMGEALAERFHDCRFVTIDNKAGTRKYHSYGETGICYTHGNMKAAMIKELPLIMATEAREIWSRTKYREIHLGHKHTNITMESHGVQTIFCPSLCAADAWHNQEGYTKNLRAATGHLYERDLGPVARFTYIAQ